MFLAAFRIGMHDDVLVVQNGEDFFVFCLIRLVLILGVSESEGGNGQEN